MITSKSSGRMIYFEEEQWFWADTGEPAHKVRTCGNCKNTPTVDGHDACLGTLGGVANACCGHGDAEVAYVQFWDGTSIGGEDARAIQEILKRNRTSDTDLDRLQFLAGSCQFVAEKVAKG